MIAMMMMMIMIAMMMMIIMIAMMMMMIMIAMMMMMMMIAMMMMMIMKITIIITIIIMIIIIYKKKWQIGICLTKSNVTSCNSLIKIIIIYLSIPSISADTRQFRLFQPEHVQHAIVHIH